jgi:ABC-2 type transport system permease protein
MGRTGRVALHEMRTALGRRSFWLMTLLFPLLILGITLGNSLATRLEGPSLGSVLAGEAPAEVLAYVDESGLLDPLPPGLPPEVAPVFATESEARAAVERGEIDGYYLLPADLVAEGEVILVQRDFQPLGAAMPPGPVLRYLVAHGLTGDAARAAALVDPTGEVDVRLTGEQEGAATGDGAGGPGPAPRPPALEGPAAAVAPLVPYAAVLVLFFVITASSGFLLQSVTREKENRTAEMLLIALPARHLMLGKLLGLGAVALVQVSVWAAAGAAAALYYVDLSDLGALGIGADLLAWAVAFLLLAHLAYGSMVAALGALVPSQREGSQFLVVVLLPLMVPLWFNYALTSDPHGPLAVGLSLFPLSAPAAMMARLAAGGVPLWQVLTSAAGLALTAYAFVLLAARIFAADRLLSLEALRWQTLARALRGPRA